MSTVMPGTALAAISGTALARAAPTGRVGEPRTIMGAASAAAAPKRASFVAARKLPVRSRGLVAAQAATSPGTQQQQGMGMGGGGGGGLPTAGFLQEDEALSELPSDAAYKWSREGYSARRRSVDIWTFFIALRARLFLLDKKWSYLEGYSEERLVERRRQLASWLRESLLQLGPTFIKLGQLCSTRADLFPAEVVAELSKLQDRVPAFSAERAVQLVEEELGAPVASLYKTFDPSPLAAASLGQVHRATLKTGEAVVVKVQRPGLKQLFDIDLANLEKIAALVDKSDENSDFSGIYREYANILYQEIDYIREGSSADRFRRNFRRSQIDWVRTPMVYWRYTSPRVITLEYLPGTKITQSAQLSALGVDAALVARRATEAYLVQILKHGLYHADPHPGNISVDAQGRLLFYDFGMMGEIPGNVRENLLEVFYGTYRKDAQQVLDALVNLKVIVPQGDNLSVRRSIQFFLERLGEQTERKETIENIGEDLFAVAVDQPFRFPANFSFVLRAFSTLEGIGKALDSDYDFQKVASPYAQELLDLRNPAATQDLIVSELQKQAGENVAATMEMPRAVQRIDNSLRQLEAGELKLRVRVLEAERADRRASVLQMATMNCVAAVAFMDSGVTLLTSGHERMGAAALAAAVGFGIALGLGMRRIKRLDKFEKQIKGGGSIGE